MGAVQRCYSVSLPPGVAVDLPAAYTKEPSRRRLDAINFILRKAKEDV